MKKCEYIYKLLNPLKEKYENIDKYIPKKYEKLESTKNLSDYIESIRSHIRTAHEKRGNRKGFRNTVQSDQVLYELFDLFRKSLHDTRIKSSEKAIIELYIMNCFSYKEIGLLLKKRQESIKKIVEGKIALFSDKILAYLDDEV